MKALGYLLAVLLAAGFWTWVGAAAVWGLVRKFKAERRVGGG